MAEVLSPPSTSTPPSPRAALSHDESSSSTASTSTSSLSPMPRHTQQQQQSGTHDRISLPSVSHSHSQSQSSSSQSHTQSQSQNRTSQYSQRSSRSRTSSNVYPAFASSLSYALVRDFAYPPFHPMHYGAEPEPSGASTPSSEWNPMRRQSDPLEQWNSGSVGGGRSAGPWGGDGVLYGGPEQQGLGASYDDGGGGVENLPSTAFGSEGSDATLEEDIAAGRRRPRHRKSKSYTGVSELERGRRRESDGVFFFHGSQTDPAGRDSLRLSRGYSGNGVELGGGGGGNGRRDSPFAAGAGSTLPNRSFQTSSTSPPFSQQNQLQRQSQPHLSTTATTTPDDRIPLDTEPHATHSPFRDSLGPEDEDLFAGLSLALYSFEPENSNELRLIEGQELLVSYRHGQGWLVASDPETGEQGLVPEAYVRLIADIPGYDPSTGQFVEIEEGVVEGGKAGGESDVRNTEDEDDEDDDDEEESGGVKMPVIEGRGGPGGAGKNTSSGERPSSSEEDDDEEDDDEG